MKAFSAVFVLALLCCSSAAAVPALSETAKKIKDRLDPAVFEAFGDEIQDSYPAHVKAYAIVKAHILGKREVEYCPLKTSQCGENPICGHPKKKRTVYDIDVVETLYSSAPAKAVPKSLPGYTLFNAELEVNDEAWMSLYVYDRQVSANGDTNVSRIKRIGKAKPIDPEPAKPKPKFSPRPR